MRAPRSLQGRLALWLGAGLMVLWIAAASVTALLARQQMNEVFNSALAATAQRLLPLVVVDIIGREEEGITQRLAAIPENDAYFTYLVRDDQDRILLQSFSAEPASFPEWDGPGFRETATHRLYGVAALQGTIRVTVAEPLAHRASVAREIQLGLGLPLLVVVPLALAAIILTLRANLAPLNRFRDRLADRTMHDLSAIPITDLPAELAPVGATLNELLARLDAAFQAERGFAANAAHELRTPLAGAIAQVQRLQAETADPATRQRAAEIETSLKRLTGLSSKLLELSRAEGAPLRSAQTYDLRPVFGMLVDDLARLPGGGRIAAHLPDQAVPTDIDPDAVGIVLRNLVENALRHGVPDAPIAVELGENGSLRVANDGPAVAPDSLKRLTRRFERGAASSTGSGLGLSIVAAIAERLGAALVVTSPRKGAASGFEVTFTPQPPAA
ncbi:ATP-binding protein [Seohaeicola saemankumensis]|uniref:sensor histidine kinase n=1 Tax=Seohaeicola saemankumensis TaxID=481181 RepID=UPI0035CF925C